MRMVFVCTGNICRSPLAEYLCRHQVAERGLTGLQVTSAGLLAAAGSPASDGALRIGAAHGLDLSPHRAQRLDPASLGAEDLVLVMEHWHRQEILSSGAIDSRAVRLLGQFDPARPEEVEDPVGGPDAAFERCLGRLQACLDGLFTWLEDERIARA